MTNKAVAALLGLSLAACAAGGKSAYMAPAASYTSSSSSSSGGRAIASEPQPAERPGLGTSWGEQVSAPISYTPFTRASSEPWAEMVLHYNDADGVAAHAAYLGAPTQPVQLEAGDGSLTVSIVDEAGRMLPGYLAGDKTLVVGANGERYRIVVRNSAPVRFEIVASVDGLDVIDGKPADPARRGYLIDPNGVLVIDGFRTSDAEVAAFRFGSVAQSYAAQTAGDRDVGVIGLAVFAERGAVWSHTVTSRGEIQLRDTANPFPARGYAEPPPR